MKKVIVILSLMPAVFSCNDDAIPEDSVVYADIIDVSSEDRLVRYIATVDKSKVVFIQTGIIPNDSGVTYSSVCYESLFSEKESDELQQIIKDEVMSKSKISGDKRNLSKFLKVGNEVVVECQNFCWNNYSERSSPPLYKLLSFLEKIFVSKKDNLVQRSPVRSEVAEVFLPVLDKRDLDARGGCIKMYVNDYHLLFSDPTMPTDVKGSVPNGQLRRYKLLSNLKIEGFWIGDSILFQVDSVQSDIVFDSDVP